MRLGVFARLRLQRVFEFLLLLLAFRLRGILLGTVKFLAHFLTGGRPAVRYGYSCSSDTSR